VGNRKVKGAIHVTPSAVLTGSIAANKVRNLRSNLPTVLIGTCSPTSVSFDLS